MKILLIQSYLGGGEPLVVPLGLLTLSAALSGHEVKVFDTNAVAQPLVGLRELADVFQPDVIGISLRNIDSTNKEKVVFYYPYLAEMLDVLEGRVKVPIIIGGSGFSMFAEEIMTRERRLDFGIYLEGELAFSDLLAHLDRPQEVSSVFYRDPSGRVHFTGRGRSADLFDLQMPRWDILPDLESYKIFHDAFGVETKRGCALGCIYCVYGFLNGKTYRLKNVVAIVDEIEELVTTHGVQRFTFVDSIFNFPIDHCRNVCSELASRNLPIRWSAWFNEQFFDKDLLVQLEKAGCDHIIFSPDGFTDTVLRQLGKNTRKQHILESFQLLCANTHFEVSYNFFKNPPGQSIANFVGMMLFCMKAKIKLGKRVHFEFSVLRVEPHTKLLEIAVNEGGVAKGECLLEPCYYTNKRTWYIEVIFDKLLAFLGK